MKRMKTIGRRRKRVSDVPPFRIEFPPSSPHHIITVLANRASPRLLAYAVPVLMLFSLAWLAVVDFRFATSCWEGYHFWIPVVEYVWYIQYTIFPL